jgi:hypothetical protein
MTEPFLDAYCKRATDEQVTDAWAKFVSVMEAMHRKDDEALVLLCEGVSPFEYHVGASITMRILNELGRYGFDPLGTLERLRSNVNEALGNEAR